VQELADDIDAGRGDGRRADRDVGPAHVQRNVGAVDVGNAERHVADRRLQVQVRVQRAGEAGEAKRHETRERTGLGELAAVGRVEGELAVVVRVVDRADEVGGE